MAKEKKEENKNPVQKEFKFSGASYRLEGEDFEEYKARRKMLNALQKQKLKGEKIWPSHVLGRYLKGFKGKEKEIMQKLQDYAENKTDNLDSDTDTESKN